MAELAMRHTAQGKARTERTGMGAVQAEIARARRAFSRPTLALLNKHYAPIVIAIFGSIFSAQRKAIPSEQFHLEIAGHLEDLKALNETDLPELTPRKLSSGWVRDTWLVRSVNDFGDEEYSLTSHAQEAMDFVSRAGGERPLVSESRIRTLLDAVERFATDAQPDRATRITSLNSQIRALQAEKKRLEAGGEVESAPDDRLEEQFDHVRYLVRELPADFTRVAESIKDLQRTILAQLRNDARPTGEVLSEYIAQSESLFEQTPEGKAFTGAMDLLQSEKLLRQLDTSIDAILNHPFARNIPTRDREQFRGIKATILDSLGVVLAEQQRASRTLTTQIRHHNPLRDRELDDALRGAVVALHEWFPSSTRGEQVEPLTRFERANFGRIRTSVHDLSDDTPPDAIDQNSSVDIAGLELNDIIAMGGPRHRELLAHVQGLLTEIDHDVTVATAFDSAHDSLKRPVEILGYQEIATTHTPADNEANEDLSVGSSAPLERIIAVRADGSTREFIIPRQKFISHFGAENND